MQGMEPSFGKGLLVSFAIYSASIPLALVPVIGVFLAITLVPYLSSALGTRFAHPRERLPLSLTVALVWSSFETAVILMVVKTIANSTPMGFRMDRIGIVLIGLLYLSNLVFGLLGAVHPWKDPFPSEREGKDNIR
jgi:uncharacterized membrane protein required for colicin V production